MNLLERLKNDRFDASEGTELERAYRRGWNAAMEHATGVVRIEQGLDEFTRSATYDWPRARQTFDFDLGGES